MENKELERAVVEWYNARIDLAANPDCRDCKRGYAHAIGILSAKAAVIITAKELGLKRKRLT